MKEEAGEEGVALAEEGGAVAKEVGEGSGVDGGSGNRSLERAVVLVAVVGEGEESEERVEERSGGVGSELGVDRMSGVWVAGTEEGDGRVEVEVRESREGEVVSGESREGEVVSGESGSAGS